MVADAPRCASLWSSRRGGATPFRRLLVPLRRPPHVLASGCRPAARDGPCRGYNAPPRGAEVESPVRARERSGSATPAWRSSGWRKADGRSTACAVSSAPDFRPSSISPRAAAAAVRPGSAAAPCAAARGARPSASCSAVASAVSSWRSRPAAASCGALSTSMFGSVPWFSTPQPTSLNQNEYSGCVVSVPSTSSVARPDADDAAPGARAHQRADAHQLEAVREDVAVAAGVFVGQRHHRAGGRFLGVGRGAAPARHVVGDALARHLLQQQLRDMAAAVVAQVDDQRVAVAFGAEVAVELGEAVGHHVGQVQVADAPGGLLVHPGAVVFDPFAVARRHLVGQRRHQHLALVAPVAARQRQLHLAAGLVHQQRLRRARARHRAGR